MTVKRYAVVGGGIVGVAVGRRLLHVDPTCRVTVLEKEPELALHQTGRNSGVVHAGLYYAPGSLKALLCRRGVALLQYFCAEKGIRYDQCGKVLVALDEMERERLTDIAERAQANGVPGVRHVDRDELRALEPHVHGVAGLHSPSTAIVDYREVTRQLAADAEQRGATVRTGWEVTGLLERGTEVVVRGGHEELAFDAVILCAGLQTDRVAALAGGEAAPRIVPFRGEYFLLRPEKRHLVRGWSTRCLIPAIPSSECTSRHGSTVRSWSAPTPSWRSRARATAGPTSLPVTCGRCWPTAASAPSPSSTGAPG